MTFIAKSEAEKLLAPYLDSFSEGYQNAINDWQTLVAQFPTATARTRACFINDRIREHIRRVFPSEYIHERGGRFFLQIGKIAGRFKKLNRSLPSNIPTQIALKLVDQQLELGVALEPLTLINIGYSFNRRKDNYEFEIVCNKGKEILWKIPLSDSTSIYNPIEIPVTDVAEPKEIKRRVFKKVQ